MNSLDQLLDKMLEDNIQIGLLDGKLRVIAETGTLNEDLKALIVQNKDKLIDWLKEKSNVGSDVQGIISVPRMDHHPLSFTQEALWLVSQYEGKHSRSYNVPWISELKGYLNVEALNRAFEVVVSRHESLRTRFEGSSEHEVRQVIESDLKLNVVAEKIQEEDLQEIIETHCSFTFDLAKGPLFTVRLLSIEEQRHVLLVNMHHIISDAWSMGVIFNELFELYTSFIRNQSAPSTKQELDYVDYAHWQRECLSGESLKDQAKYWIEKLESLPPLSTFPTKGVRPGVQTFVGSSVRRTYSKELIDGLQRKSKESGVTTYVIMSAAFSYLLSRYSGQNEIAIGTPLVNRPRLELENMVGLFVNSVVLRNDYSQSKTVEDLLNQMKITVREAQQNGDIPFQHVVDALCPERSPSYHSLFQVMFTLQNAVDNKFSLPGLEVINIPHKVTRSRFDLTCIADETSEGLDILVEYSTVLFEREFIDRLLSSYEYLLTQICSNKETLLSDINFSGFAENLSVGHDFKESQTANRNYISKFECWAEREPEKLALALDENEITYSQLNSIVNQFSSYLKKEQNIGPNKRVAVCLERSFDSVISLLAIHKLGACYVPLDHNFPRERIKFILNDSRADLLLTNRKLFSRILTDDMLIPWIEMEQKEILSNQYSMDNINTSVNEQYPCYIIFTSGSTGIPKGIELPYRVLMNLVDCDDHGKPLRTMQYAPSNFDVSLQEVFTTLSCGGSLNIVKEHLRRDISGLIELINRKSIQKMYVPVTILHAIAEVCVKSDIRLESLISIVTAGEALVIDKNTRIFLQNHPKVVLGNHYGPSETHVATTYVLPYESYPNDSEYSVPIGKALSNCDVLILDEQFIPVPNGVVGEIYIKGDCLANGYIERTKLTAEKFLPAVSSSIAGSRMYRTGDLGKYNPDGELEFMGRIDDQIKLRGFRIEPKEVEHYLKQHYLVEKATVLLHDSGILLAYVVITEEGQHSTRDLESQIGSSLRNVLPDYMIPDKIIFLDSLPLNANGKVDRKILSTQPLAKPDDGRQAMPQTETEKTLLLIWSEVIEKNTDQISLVDSFFSQGGNSLLATKICSRIKNLVNLHIPMKAIFSYPSIRLLAGLIDKVKSIDDTGIESLDDNEVDIILEIVSMNY